MNVRRLRVRCMRSAAGSINSGRHVLAFTMRRALRKRPVFDFVPSYLNSVFTLSLPNSVGRNAPFFFFFNSSYSSSTGFRCFLAMSIAVCRHD